MIRSFSSLPAALLIGSLFCCPVLGADTETGGQDEGLDAKEWIRSMREASSHVRFQGIAAYWRDEQLRILRVRHDIVNGQEREQVDALDDTYSDDAAPLGEAASGLPALVHNPFRMSQGPLNLTLAERYYRFSVGGAGRIGDRNVREIVISPLDNARYGRRVWIDRESRLPVKHELVSPDGRILEQFVFAELAISNTPLPANQAAEGNSQPLAGHVPVQQAIDTLTWRLENVPKGYRIVAYARHNASDNSLIEHLLLSDGFSPISVYIEEARHAFPHDGRLRHFGAMHVFSRQAGQHRITVMAETPASSVIQIAQGVRRGDP